MLELDEGKLSRPVLRRGDGSNPGSLAGQFVGAPGRNEMDPPLCGPTVMSHNEFTIREPIEPQEASPMKHEMNGLPCKFLARGSHVHVSGCPQGTWQLCRTVAFWRQNPKIGSRKIKDLGASTFLFSVMCDRALGPRATL